MRVGLPKRLAVPVPASGGVRPGPRLETSRLAPLLLAAAFLVGGCTNAPPAPLVTSPVAQTTPSKRPDLNEVVVGVDGVSGGYNPHTLAGQSSAAAALATLMLPSVFRQGPDGTPQLDRRLVTSAQVTKAEPFTVSYTLRKNASWSDSAPIAAEDFVYLWQQMRSEPGVVDPAGYRLISDISPRDGGKTVDVAFGRPYPGWRSLFGGLLPAHLLKDAPGGWARALTESYPATGGPFSVKTLDRDRGEIILERNDRWWDTPAAVMRIVLRRADLGGLTSALRNGDDQVAVLRADAIGVNLLRELGAPVTLATVPGPNVVRLLLRPASPRMADVRVRAAVASALDRDALVAVGTGNGPSAQLRADAQVLAPSHPGYLPTLAASGTSVTPDLPAVERLLTEAGYVRVAGAWMREGKALRLVLAAPADREPYVALASQVRQQLAAAGIDASVTTPSPDQFYRQQLAGPATVTGTESDSAIDIAVLPQPVGGDGATELASSFGCRSTLSDGNPAPPNPAGFCDQAIQSTVDAALTGAMETRHAPRCLEGLHGTHRMSRPIASQGG